MNWHGLRIAIVGPLPPPAGGMAGQTEQLARLLRDEGAQVALVQSNAPYRPSWIGHVRAVRALFRLVAYIGTLWRTLHTVQLVHLMANSGWSWHLCAVPAIVIGRLHGVPVVVNYRGGEAQAFLARSARWVVPVLRGAAAVAVPSAFLEQVFRVHGVTTSIVPNVVDVARFRPGARASSAPVILVARNLEAIYDNATAIAAFAHIASVLPSARLVIAGSGPEEPALRNQAASLRLDDSVEFAGRLSRDEMAARYRDASVVLNPSRVDNMPNSLLEALASGVPVVSTNVGGVPHVVTHECTALLVPPSDPKAMALAVLRVLQDAPLAQRMSAAGLAEVQRYTWLNVRGILASVYERALRLAVERVSPA